MVELKRTDLSVRAERAVLLYTLLHKDKNDEAPLEELKSLAETAGAKVLEALCREGERWILLIT